MTSWIGRNFKIYSFPDDISIVETLIQAGASVNAKGPGDWEPIHSAAYADNEKIATVLINNGANVNATDRDGNTPLHLAAQDGESTHFFLNKWYK